ncbi:uncharacterized protein LOC129944593 [Eupeodes corollae]|uniref:uncharacterized protein LOC129944593 n=1 Tax=Eupeodes corollae TaxID=290404 RepID=UPI002490FA13|nr:uncharacterized protein LOC129944593 [Eupeodes corollae]
MLNLSLTVLLVASASCQSTYFRSPIVVEDIPESVAQQTFSIFEEQSKPRRHQLLLSYPRSSVLRNDNLYAVQETESRILARGFQNPRLRLYQSQADEDNRVVPLEDSDSINHNLKRFDPTEPIEYHH